MENITPHKYTGSPPMVKVSSHAIHVVWEQLDEDGKFHIYYRKGEFAQSSSHLALGERSYDFAPTALTTVRTAWLHLKNTGSDSLTIGTVISDDSNFTVSPSQLSVPPGDSATVRVTFMPLREGPKEGNIIFYHGGASSPDHVAVSGQAIAWNSVIGKWSMISTPFNLDPGFSLPLLYGWDNSYVQSETMSVGRGYWAKLAAPIVYEGTPVLDDSIEVRSGWNVVGAVALPMPVASIITDPWDNLASSFFGYVSGKYAAVDTLKPGYGYWVKAKQDGTIILLGTMEKDRQPRR